MNASKDSSGPAPDSADQSADDHAVCGHGGHHGHRSESPKPAAGAGTIYTCPMHPEVQQEGPGTCPKCGMALEPMGAPAGDSEDAELKDMTRRFWVSAVLSLPLLIYAMGDMIPGAPLHGLVSPSIAQWIQLVLATPVVLWGGWPFLVRGVQSVKT